MAWSAVNKGLETTKIVDALSEVRTTQGVVTGQVQPVVQTLVQMVMNLQAWAKGPVTGMGSGSLVVEAEAKAERAQLARCQDALANHLQALLEKSERQETAPAALRAGHTMVHGYGGGAQQPGATANDLQELSEMLGHLQDEVAGLQVDNSHLRAAMDSEVLTFGGFSFPMDESVELFVVANIPGNYYGFCYDIVSLLECYRDRSRTTQEGLSHKHNFGRAGFKDGGSAPPGLRLLLVQ
jgi:hypothetical protein